MQYYLAPMEGITTWIYRKAHAEVYGALDKYFIPFLETHEKRDFKTRELQEILPAHNEGIRAVPQILTKHAGGFIKVARALKSFGYDEINLNLGCPSKTVVSRHKGSGFLAFPEELDRFLEEIFSALDVKLSVKTRVGKDSPEEFGRLLSVYNKYPLEELIVHPRIQADYYKGAPRMECYEEARKRSRNPLCYNGDLFTQSCIRRFCGNYPKEERLMIGRGLILNPGLIHGGTKEQLWEFHGRLVDGYLGRGLSETSVLFKMKELWFYQIHLFADTKKYEKQIRKVQSFPEYQKIVEELFRERDLCPPA
ncbi:MAG: tRNA-dihydrouridine synthase family protein [Lachnospiraceae bacterium]|nr:tRNA-dihydrouridine synthase family protein [Lachnospiraceae bacterium]